MPNACLMASFLNFYGLEIYVVIISILDIKFCIRFCWAMLSGNFSVCCCCWIFFMKASLSSRLIVAVPLSPYLHLFLLFHFFLCPYCVSQHLSAIVFACFILFYFILK